MNKTSRKKINSVIIGSGNIGIDLAERILKDENFVLEGLIGRRADSPGLARMRERGIQTYSQGLEEFMATSKALDRIDVFFDATSALDHVRHWRAIEGSTEAKVIDLTPSQIGLGVVPLIDFADLKGSKSRNFSMVTCGGQSSGPILKAMVDSAVSIDEVEISSSIASDSAGPATRRNLDHYITATEAIASRIGACPAKAILVLNPSVPQVVMRTSVTVKSANLSLRKAQAAAKNTVQSMKEYVPNYNLVLPPTQIGENTYLCTVSVEGEGLYLPKYSGNLDIINAAAVATAKLIAD